MPEERFVTEKEAARIIGYSVHWFRKRRQQGGGPPFMKIDGYAIRYPLIDLIDWMNSFGVRLYTGQQNAKPRRVGTSNTRILRKLVNGRERLVLVD